MDKIVLMYSYLEEGIKPLVRGCPPKVNIMVFDTETESNTTGDPYFLSFCTKNDGKYVTRFLNVTSKTILDDFLDLLYEFARPNETNLMFVHNLSFDRDSIFCRHGREIYNWVNSPPLTLHDHRTGEPRIHFSEGKIYIQKVAFMQGKLRAPHNKRTSVALKEYVKLPEIKDVNLWREKSKKCMDILFGGGAPVKFIDTMAFFPTSLEGLSKRLGLKHVKRRRCKNVLEGRKPKGGKEREEFRRYTSDEILATCDLAEHILGMHREYDVPISMSAPSFAAHVFKRRYLKSPIQQIPQDIRWIAEYSYHGARSGQFVDFGYIPDVCSYDYNSFYPWAMTQLPPFTSGKWKRKNEFDSEREGFYVVDGAAHSCKYPVILKDNARFLFANDEHFSGAVLTSYELREALEKGEMDIIKIWGYVFVPDKNAENPLIDFVNHFYELKQSTPDDDPQYFTFKLCLNSLYGKFIQTTRISEHAERGDFKLNLRTNTLERIKVLHKAGGIYLPHIASWITGLCRAVLHDYLHKHSALDCATDSFKTLRNDIPTGENLGELKLEHRGGTLFIRPKFYIIFTPEISNRVDNEFGGDLRACLKEVLKTIPKEQAEREKFKDSIIQSEAHHGYSKKDILGFLKDIYVPQKDGYEIRRMIRPREAAIRRIPSRTWENRVKHLKIDWRQEKPKEWYKEIGLCGMPMIEALREKELCRAPNCSACPYITEF